jgi:hypothetical protein
MLTVAGPCLERAISEREAWLAQFDVEQVTNLLHHIVVLFVLFVVSFS